MVLTAIKGIYTLLQSSLVVLQTSIKKSLTVCFKYKNICLLVRPIFHHINTRSRTRE